MHCDHCRAFGCGGDCVRDSVAEAGVRILRGDTYLATLDWQDSLRITAERKFVVGLAMTQFQYLREVLTPETTALIREELEPLCPASTHD